MEIESNDENENLVRRRQVRLNIRQTISVIVVGSLTVLLGVLVYSLVKIIIVWVILRSYLETYDQPLGVWLWGVLVLDCINLPFATEAFLRACQARENRVVENHPLLNLLNTLSRIAYFLWQLLGNYWYYSCDCADTAPHYWKLAYWVLVLAYIYYSSPVIVICAALMCMPLFTFIARHFQFTLSQGATESQLRSLIECLVEGEENGECPICTVPFNHGERVLRMPCDERHRFHKECLSNWLRIKADCPICRTQLN